MILLVQEICEPNHADHVIGHLVRCLLYLHGVFIKAAVVCQKYLNLSVVSVIARLHNDKLLMIYKE